MPEVRLRTLSTPTQLTRVGSLLVFFDSWMSVDLAYALARQVF